MYTYIMYIVYGMLYNHNNTNNNNDDNSHVLDSLFAASR